MLVTPPEAPSLAGPKLGGYSLVFKVDTGQWTNQVVIAPWGNVVAIGGHHTRLLARHSGEELLRTPICFVQAPDAAAFVDDTHLLVACDDGVDEVTFPDGSIRQVFKFPAKLALTAIGGGRLVAAADGFFVKDDPHVRIYALGHFLPIDEFDAGGPVRAVGISADGRFVAAGVEGKGLLVRDAEHKVSRGYLQNSDGLLRRFASRPMAARSSPIPSRSAAARSTSRAARFVARSP